mgnify:CR=1 FL=1
MNSTIKIGIGVIVVILLLLIFFVGYKYFYKDFIKKSDEPLLKIPEDRKNTEILFLHHSTGKNIWDCGVKGWYVEYNNKNNTNYSIQEQSFPKRDLYGWNNYPYDYWNIWVNHAGEEPYKNEPTLEMITQHYDIVIFKHCFPVSSIEPESGEPQVDSNKKTVGNYKLQYAALKEKMKEFPETKFIIWTGAVQVESKLTEEQGSRTKEFFDWVRETWDENGDNIYLWDFYELETEGGLYLKQEYAESATNSHPNKEFSKDVAPLLCQRTVDVIEGRGDTGNITGRWDD